jgi:hypothetical protein
MIFAADGLDRAPMSACGPLGSYSRRAAHRMSKPTAEVVKRKKQQILRCPRLLTVGPRAVKKSRDDVAFFQAVRASLAKRATGEARTDEELDHALRQIVSCATRTRRPALEPLHVGQLPRRRLDRRARLQQHGR